MASYVSPNYNPAYFELPIFEAPTDTAFKVAQFKQGQFDQGLKQVQAQYQNYLNIPVASEYNKARRDAFMKDAQDKLKQIFTADFSLDENVNAAGNIYKPLVQDKSIIKEMSQIKRGQKASQEYEVRSNSKDENVRKTANQYSQFLTNYEMTKIAGAKTQEELDAVDESNLSYVPATDYQERFAKQMTQIVNGGGGVSKDNVQNTYYMRTLKNGEQAKAPFTQLGLSLLTPEDIAYFQSAGKAQLIQTEQGYVANGMNKDEARTRIVQDVMNTEFEKYNVQVSSVEKELGFYEQAIKDINNAGTKGSTPEEVAQVDQKLAVLTENVNRLTTYKSNLVSERNNFDPNFDKGSLYSKKFDFYKARPEVGIGGNIAYRMASNIASSFAMSTAQEKIDENKVTMKFEEYKVKALEFQAKAAAKEAEKKDKEGEEAETPIMPLGVETKTIPVEKVYDYVQNRKKELITSSNIYGLELTKEIINMSGDIKMNMKNVDDLGNALSNGKGAEVAPPEMVAAFGESLGKSISGPMTFAQLNNKVVEVSKQKLQATTENPDLTTINQDAITRAVKFREALNLNETRVKEIKKKEDEISNNLLTKEKYKDLRVQNEDGTFRLQSEDEFLDRNTVGKRQFIINYTDPNIFQRANVFNPQQPIRDVKEMTISEAKKFAKDNGIPLEKMEIVNPDYNYRMNPITGLYDIVTGNMTPKGERIQGFAPYLKAEIEKYETKINPVKEKVATELAPTVDGLSITAGQKSIGFQNQKFKLPFSTKSNDILGEQVVNTMLDDEFIRNVGASYGLKSDDIGTFTSMVTRLKGASGGLKAEDGYVEVSPTGEDGRSPQYKLVFSTKYLNEQITKEEREANPDIYKRISDGIIINNPNVNQKITNELNSKFSLIASSVDSEVTGTKKFVQMDDNHYVQVRYNGNGRYLVAPALTENGAPAKIAPQEVGKERLDLVIRQLENQVISAYLASKQKASAKTAFQIIKEKY